MRLKEHTGTMTDTAKIERRMIELEHDVMRYERQLYATRDKQLRLYLEDRIAETKQAIQQLEYQWQESIK